MCSVATTTLRGVEAIPVEVEVDVGAGLPSFSIVGLPDAAVQEARERVRSAIRASGFQVPNSRVVVNLAPGPLRKHGTGFDLPMAIGILVATNQLPSSCVDSVVAVGELSLDGTVRPVPGLLSHSLSARKRGLGLLASAQASTEATLPRSRYLPLDRLSSLRTGIPSPRAHGLRQAQGFEPAAEMADVVGQEHALRALIIAAAGGLNVLMVGPPGAGKTMLARRLPGILPPLTPDEALETALVHSVAGLDETLPLSGVRPFRAPHHAASTAGLIGGGSPPRPGEVSLAHNGVLFLDEMPEFGPAALQNLRQPLEDGHIDLVRADGRISFPASFTLIGAANPCPCGYLGDRARQCRCSDQMVDRYQARIGGPLLDRMDIVVRVDRPDPSLLVAGSCGISTSEAREKVLEARERAMTRRSTSVSRLSGAQLLDAARMCPAARAFLERSARTEHLSGRGITRLLRLAVTLTDLEGGDAVGIDELTEALSYRGGL